MTWLIEPRRVQCAGLNIDQDTYSHVLQIIVRLASKQSKKNP